MGIKEVGEALPSDGMQISSDLETSDILGLSLCSSVPVHLLLPY